ncbi:hypothetical protein CBF34_06230 [Vagococcus penaei]|uniref:Uncharacterized protein n=1 Tax=Vagococcus penaei TaxID=633807 RepID=A0A1Q2D747_9ENTE|nr:GNAT family N-acetyltransferase [Vagococcus penaei]AQP54131.1 hypothetical protein BW732_07810 [Vagococcus penaei]RSU02130.1 hypothetical protein CBF34_06230 [Vagococcus penaei]
MKEFSHPTFPTIKIRLLTEKNDFTTLKKFLLETKDYFTDYQDSEPTDEQISTFFNQLPPKTALYQKNVYGIFDQETMIGLIDWVIDYPEETQSIIGLFALRADYRGIGLAQPLYEALEQMAKETGSKLLVLGCLEDNTHALNFWKKQQFTDVKLIESAYGPEWVLKKEL